MYNKIFAYCYEDRIGWFRIFGYGLVIKDTRKHRLLFSERYGLTKYIKIGPWFVKGLLPDKRNVIP